MNSYTIGILRERSWSLHIFRDGSMKHDYYVVLWFFNSYEVLF